MDRKRYIWVGFMLITLLGAYMSPTFAQVMLKRQVVLMGAVFEITIVDKDTVSVNQNIDRVVEEVQRIESLISEWRPETQISKVNQQAGIRPVKVDREVFELTQRAIAYSEMTDGAFDISIAGMDQLWRFDGSMSEMPDREEIRLSVQKVGFRHIQLDSLHSTIFLALSGMRIGFGSIGKGYVADKGRELMKRLGVKGGIVNASGDLSAWGAQPDGKPWVIGIGHPIKPYKILKKLKFGEKSVATSGNSQKYVEINGVRYAHIIDPKTGYPASGLASVTVYGPSAEFANALSTSAMVMGLEKGRALIKKSPAYSYLIVSDEGKLIRKK